MTTIAAVQLNAGDDQKLNLACTQRLLERAVADGGDLVVLPENFSWMPGDPGRRRDAAEADGQGPVQDFVAEQAARHSIWIVAGTIPIRSDNPMRPYSACCVYDSAGNRVGRYDKTHLFDVDVPDSEERYRESDFTTPGSGTLIVDLPWGRLGVAVCYDLRFPELFRRMSADGVDVFAIPAAFTVPTGRAHWETLLRARAIENLCYVVSAAQTGRHPGDRETWGHSMIVDPWGEILQNAGNAEIAITAGFSGEALAGLRSRFPSLDHRLEENKENA